jgi:hypothetical protein
VIIIINLAFQHLHHLPHRSNGIFCGGSDENGAGNLNHLNPLPFGCFDFSKITYKN